MKFRGFVLSPVVWMMELLGVRPGGKGKEESLETLKKRLKAAGADCQTLERQEGDLRRQCENAERRRRELSDERQRLEKAVLEIGGSLSEIQTETNDLRKKCDELRAERENLERELETYRYHSLLNQKAVVKARLGDSFFLRFDIEEPEEAIVYPRAVLGAKSFAVPAELPPITECGDGVRWAFEDKMRGSVAVVEKEYADALSGRLVFAGDIHGDADALRIVVEQTFRAREDAVLVFLGDLIDRGDGSLEAARILFWTARRFPGQLLWLAGNHDIGLRFDEIAGKFASEVQPAEFADWLNSNDEAKTEALYLVKEIRQLPRACIIGDVWASHGGVPQGDVSGNFTSFQEMTGEMLEDCVWSRMKDAPAKLPNRSHKGAEVGFKDAQTFFSAVEKAEKIKIRHIVCAHQHEHRDGLACLQFGKCFKPDVLSCQCVFSFRDTTHDVRPCYLEYAVGKIPVPHTF